MKAVQQYSSERTSINSGKVPQAFTTYQDKIGFVPRSLILDYGGGKFDTAVEYMARYGSKVLIYDKYNRTAEHNKMVMTAVRHRKPDYIVCCNVLNVIQENNVVELVVRTIKRLSGANTVVIFKIHEGDGSGHGRPTGPTQYQRNQKTDAYLPLIWKYFPNAIKKYGLIIA